MFVTRLLSGIVLMIIMFLAFHLGTPVLTVLLFAVTAIGYHELCKVLLDTAKQQPIGTAAGTPAQASSTTQSPKTEATVQAGSTANATTQAGSAATAQAATPSRFSLPEIIGYLGIAAYYVVLLAADLGVLTQDKMQWLMAAIVFTLLGELAIYVFNFPKYTAEDIGLSVFSFLYAPVMLSFIDMTRMLDKGILLVWLILICSWGCDTCAYCVGILIGKRKVFPVLSPKKSLEGCIGGVAGAMILGALFGKFLMGETWQQALILAVICAFGALASMVGDLAASAIKRNKGIKDYGKLIPGHGGIMDRFDSVIVTAPMVYFLLTLLR